MTITLKQPYFSAWQKFNWTPGVEGLGISLRKIQSALVNKQHLYINYKDTTYKISPEKALAVGRYYKSLFITKGEKLVVIPANVCEKI